MEALQLLYRQQTAIVTVVKHCIEVDKPAKTFGGWKAIRALRYDKEVETAEAVVIRFQGLIRKHQAYRKMVAMGEKTNVLET